MNTDFRTIQNTAAIAGLAFIVLLVLGVFLMGTPDSNAPATEWASYFSDSGNRTQSIISAYLLVLAGLAFIVFLWALRPEFGDPVGIPALLLHISMASGIAFAMLLMAGGLATGAIAGSISFGDAPVPDGNFAREFEQLGTGLILLPGGLAAALSVAALSCASLLEDAWPRWLGIVGIVAAIVLLFSVAFIPLIALPLWTLIVAIELVARHPTPVGATPAGIAPAA